MLFGRQQNPIKIADKGVVEWKYATCGYCSTGCSIEVGIDRFGGQGGGLAWRGGCRCQSRQAVYQGHLRGTSCSPARVAARNPCFVNSAGTHSVK